MDTNEIDSQLLRKLLADLDELLAREGGPPLHLLVGGAGALVAAYGMNGRTEDLDAFSLKGDFETLKAPVAQLAMKYKLQGDWLNPHFKSFLIYLPEDWRKRIIRIFDGQKLQVDALGAEEILIMKLMAGRAKDHAHIRYLLRARTPDLGIVEARLEELRELWPKEARRALDLFDDLTEVG